MRDLHFDVLAASVLAPGLSSLADLHAISAGERTYVSTPLVIPTPAMLPAQERRRASPAVRLVLACISQALEGAPVAPESLLSVFATDEGTGEVCRQMLGAVTTTGQVSPLLFSNSVLNAPSGYFSIAWRNHQPSNVVSVGLESFASGLLCAVCDAQASKQPVLLVAYDPPMTQPMDELLPVREGTAGAWIISAGHGPGPTRTIGSFSLALQQAPGSKASPLPAWMPEAWHAHSSARGLAALALLGQPAGAAMHLQLNGGLLALRRNDRGDA